MNIYNFSAGPAMLPKVVMEEVRETFLNYRNTGASIIEIGHRSDIFVEVLEETQRLFYQLTDLPTNYKILFVHGGARMQFSAIPLNLISLSPAGQSGYVETGNFARQAWEEARRYSLAQVVASSADTDFDRIPDERSIQCDEDAAYLHITSNNTVYGTRWNRFPSVKVPLVVDATSEILSRRMDYSQFGVTYAGFQKNLGPSALALVIIRDDLLGHALPETPLLLDYSIYAKNRSLYNTPNTFAIYMMQLILRWIESLGGIAAIERLNDAKAKYIYDYLDSTEFYRGVARQEDRSTMNVTFHLLDRSLTDRFLQESRDRGLLALKGHRSVGGIRASIYNAMPIEGVKALVEFMKEFERSYG
ncbi:putative aminotransferase; putative phosphoserine aminotransferase (serC) [Microcystis aeruginosa PCC 9806]|uniref:Phosphoserine aminotransferase n=2 Tax=Microcystis TaxID=1125 RepID=A0A552LFK1_9CHRO|nr:3-phosphoserine/phosphohydroxythreonine transaminase [Microcystis aeruginosa]TRV18983.1 MAG: 3-phosphoserine/phosphohydroxythreonine transaminase [Microcystis flos-aquae Mf_WU_F_19750830_S460]CCI13726.1 putative aminotransferase; putative phosphoserine aminotransferase (serC) [Microcystis aeruginosa PCC 9806]